MSTAIAKARQKFCDILKAQCIDGSLDQIVHYQSSRDWHFADANSDVARGWNRTPLRKFASMLMISNPSVFYAVRILRLMRLHDWCASTGRANCCKGLGDHISMLDREYERERQTLSKSSSAEEALIPTDAGHSRIKRGRKLGSTSLPKEDEALAQLALKLYSRNTEISLLGAFAQAALEMNYKPDRAIDQPWKDVYETARKRAQFKEALIERR